MIMIETFAYLQPNFQIPISNHRSNIGAEFGKVEHNTIWLHILQPTWTFLLFLASMNSSHRTMIWGSIVSKVQDIAHNVKSIRRDFETRKCGSTFWVSKSCLQADQLLASPVTECRAQNLHYSLASFVTGTKALDLHKFNKNTTKCG